MEKIALKIGGVLFVFMGVMHVLRVVKNIPVSIGSMDVPLGASVFGAAITLGLGLWMLSMVCSCCCKK